ncbi:MAG: carbohydrate-binding domain-containing protein [Clostridia bacterium]|nr:carbohydrate-binding domain-containing protein [Clostridia bacterium]
MRKFTITKIASYLIVLVMVFSLTAIFTVGASAEGTAQAQWGTDAANLTSSGTLQEAIDAAKNDSSITYIKVMSDIFLESTLNATGGAFTLDLNGKKIENTEFVLCVQNSTIITVTDTSAEQTGAILSTGSGSSAIYTLSNASAQITILGGELQGGYYAVKLSSNAISSTSTLIVKGGKLIGGQYAIGALGASVTVTGGSLDGKNEDIDWSNGTLDLSNYANAANITIVNYTNADVTLPSENIMLPSGYSFYDENGNRADDVLENNSTYTIDVTKYKVTVNVADNGSANTSADDAWVLSGTEVVVNTVPDDGYRISKISVNGTPIEGTTFTMPDGDVMIDLTFRSYQAEWGTDKDTLTAWGSLQEALDAAATDANVKYIMVMRDHLIVEGGLCVTGGSFTLDLGGFTIESENYYTIDINNVNPVNLIITDTKGGGALIGPVPLKNWGGPANITIAGGTLQGENHAILIDFKNDASSLTVTGGVLQGGMYAITTCVNTTITGGILQGTACDLAWRDGTLDLAGHPNPVGITVDNETGLEQTLVLADGYNFYDEDGNKVVDGALASDTAYTVDVSKYSVTVNETENGSAAVDPSGYLAPGTVVTLVLTPNEGYKADVTVTGATFDPETNSFVVGNSNVTVDVTFKLYQAEWGTDKDTLTAWGTLEEAFDAAAAENSTVGYIKVVNNINIGSDYYWVEGGTFTLDLNGKTLTSAGHVLYLKNAVDITITDTSAEQTGKIESTDESSFAILVYDTSAIKLTIEGGTLSSAGIVIMAYSAFGEVLTVNLIIKGGTLQTAINEHIWWGSTGVLDLSDYANLTGITVNNFSGAEPNITLPAGYSFYDKNGNRVDGVFENVVYTIDETKYAFDYVVENAAVSFEPAQGDLVPGTTVTFTVDLEELYKLISVSGMTASGTELEISYNEETGTYSFAMPEDDVTVTVQAKYEPFVWGNTSDAMTSTGDFFDLVAAINAGEALYAKLLADYVVELPESDVAVSGKSFIDLNGHLLEFYAPYNSKVVLGEGADITLFVDQKVDGVNTYDYDVRGAFELQSSSKLTVSGAYLIGYIFYNGGTLDISDAHLATYCELHNLTDAEITIADVVTFAAPFRAFDPAWYNDPNYEGYTVPTVTTLAARVENIAFAYIEAVFTVTFDFGKGSGTMPTVEVSSGDFGRDIPTPEGLSHPEGLTLIGWTYEGKDYDCVFANSFYSPELADITLTAKWGAPIYVGGVGMNDGDYLASGATETTTKRPATGGYAYYKNGVLTLNNYQFTGEGFAYEYDGYSDEQYFALIYSTTDLVIELVGNSNLVGTAIYYDKFYDEYYNADTDGVRVKGDLTVRGKGSLIIEVEDDGFYIEDLIIESGTVMIISDDEAIESDRITVLGGVLNTVSEDGVDSDVVTVKGGEFYVLPEDGEDDVELNTQTLTVTGGKLVVKGYYGIYADYVTISGGVVEVEAEYGAITPCDTENENGFVTISGGKVTLSSGYSDAIYSVGDVTVSGGEVTLYGDYGIYTYGDITITGGELEIEAYEDAIYAGGNVTVLGGDIYVYSNVNRGIYSYGNITISGGDVVISVRDGYAIEACGDETAVTINGGFVHLMGHIWVSETATVTFGGKATRIFIEGDIISTNAPVITEGEIKHIFTVDGTSYYEGVEISHTWTDAYQTDETHHYHVCADEDCVVRYFYLPEFYYQYFEEANYGEHTIPEGESICSVCGYGAEVPEEELPEDVVLAVGDHYLKGGEYLTFDLDGNPIVVTEKPATGGYLHVTVDTAEESPIITIVLSNFSFEYTGVAAIVALQDNAYIMQLEGENTITAHADKNYDALYPGVTANGAGIAAIGSQIAIVGEGTLTINAEVGIFGYSSFFMVESGATVTINAQQDGIAIQNGLFAVADATLTVNAGDDGIDVSDGLLFLADASRVSVTAGDDGFALNYADFLATNATVTVVAVDDAIDADNCRIEWEKSTFDLTADDHGITAYVDSEEEYPFFVTESILDIEAGDDGIRIYGYPEVLFVGSVLNITAEDAGLYFDSTQVMFASQLGMILSLNSTPGTSGKASEININAKRNYLYDASVDVYEVKLNVVATETAFELDYAELEFMDSEISILSRDIGIYGEYESYVTVFDSSLSIEAARYGISGDLYLYHSGDLIDVSVRAFKAIDCEGIYFNEEYDYMMNAYFDGYTFLDENDDIASYVTIRGYATVNAEMEEAIEKLDQLLSEGGEFESIANSISDVNDLLNTLTNAEGEGRLDLIEKANEAINKALATLDQNLANVQTNLQNAIDTKADAETVNQSITELNQAIESVESAYAAADKALDDKLIAAQTTLDTAIKALAEKVNGAEATIAEHELAIAQLQAALEALQKANENNKNNVEEMEVELTEADQKNQIAQTVTAVVAGTSLTCNVALAAAAIILERKKGLLTSLFSGIFKK